MSTKIVGGGFPSQVNVVQAPGVAGDFASTNPRQTVDAGPGAFVAGLNGCAVGLFAWADSTNPNALNNYGAGLPLGFIHREQQALITVFLDYATMAVPQGLPVTAFSAGDFWAQNDGAVSATPGMKVYALNATGGVTFNVTGTPPAAATSTASTVDKIVSNATPGAVIGLTNTCTAGTGGVSSNVLTVAAVGTNGVLGVGQTITGAGIDPAAVITIVAQLTGTKGGIGTYQLSSDVSVATGTPITMSGGGLTITGANVTGVFAPGMSITGTNVPAGTIITGYGTGTGAAGTYTVNQVATSASASQITATNAMFLTVGGTVTGAFKLYDEITGVGVAAGSAITATAVENAALSGLGVAGTYLVSGYYTAVTSEAINSPSGVETTWVATSSGAPGELVKIKNVYNV